MREKILYKIFMDLHKEYFALYRDIFLNILEGYGMVPRSCHILRAYWYRL